MKLTEIIDIYKKENFKSLELRYLKSGMRQYRYNLTKEETIFVIEHKDDGSKLFNIEMINGDKWKILGLTMFDTLKECFDWISGDWYIQDFKNYLVAGISIQELTENAGFKELEGGRFYKYYEYLQ